MKLRLILCAILFLICSLAVADNFSDFKQPIVITKNNPTFFIKLKSNPTTGFSWFLISYDHNLIEPISHKYYVPDTKLIGAGGYEKWIFKVKSAAFLMPQVTEITMAYTRPWNLENYKPIIFKVVINDS